MNTPANCFDSLYKIMLLMIKRMIIFFKNDANKTQNDFIKLKK